MSDQATVIHGSGGEASRRGLSLARSVTTSKDWSH